MRGAAAYASTGSNHQGRDHQEFGECRRTGGLQALLRARTGGSGAAPRCSSRRPLTRPRQIFRPRYEAAQQQATQQTLGTVLESCAQFVGREAAVDHGREGDPKISECCFRYRHLGACSPQGGGGGGGPTILFDSDAQIDESRYRTETRTNAKERTRLFQRRCCRRTTRDAGTRRMPSGLLSGLDSDEPARHFIMEQDQRDRRKIRPHAAGMEHEPVGRKKRSAT